MHMAKASRFSMLVYCKLSHSRPLNLNRLFSMAANSGINEQNAACMSQTPLHIAAGNNDIEKIKELLNLSEKFRENLEKSEKKEKDKKKSKKEVDDDDDGDDSERSHLLRGFGTLLSKKKNFPGLLEITNMQGETPLHMAAKNGKSGAAQVLLENGASVEAKANNGMTPLHLAVRYSVPGKDLSTVKTLLENKADWSAKDNMSLTPLHIAVDNNNVEIIRDMLSSRQTRLYNIEATNWDGETPLHFAAKNGYNEVAKVLLDCGASLGARTHERRTPLYLAVSYSHHSSVQMLLDNKADPRVKDTLYQTPIHIAAANNKVEILESLLNFSGTEKVASEAKKEALEEINMHGETPLHVAAKNGCSEAAKVLIDHKAPVDAKDKVEWMYPLHLAVWFSLQADKSSIVDTLLECNADSNIKDNNGLTALDFLQLDNEKAREMRSQIEEQKKRKAVEAFHEKKSKMPELDDAISSIVGMDDLKEQLREWVKGLLLDEKRVALGLKTGPRRSHHLAFLGNPGTGKTMVAQILGKLLHMVGVIPSDKVTEVQRSDLIGAKTRKKRTLNDCGSTGLYQIKEAEGGILFVDEAYRLMPYKEDSMDFGKEALEEIMSAMESEEVMIVFAGYKDPMKRVISANEGFARRVTKFFTFADYTAEEMAQIINIKMTKQKEDDLLYGFKLHPSCTVDEITELIERETTEKQRNKLNGALADITLRNARQILDRRLYPLTVDGCEAGELGTAQADDLLTITLKDLEEGLKLLPREVE